MNKIVLSIFAISLFVSCDPYSSMEANIKNNTTQDLSLIFWSSSQPNDTLKIETNQTTLFQDGFSSTGSFLEPSLSQYDSIYILNRSNDILKIFEKNTEGKNIYNVDEFWQFNESSERAYEYEYLIISQDIE